MGIIADARTDLRALLGARLPALNRAQRRRFVAAQTFIAALPEVTLGADPVEEP